jgi:hypothetical protein
VSEVARVIRSYLCGRNCPCLLAFTHQTDKIIVGTMSRPLHRLDVHPNCQTCWQRIQVCPANDISVLVNSRITQPTSSINARQCTFNDVNGNQTNSWTVNQYIALENPVTQYSPVVFQVVTRTTTLVVTNVNAIAAHLPAGIRDGVTLLVIRRYVASAD